MAVRQSLFVRLLPLLLAAAFLLLRALDSIWSTSTDLAHHYALVMRLSEFWKMPGAGDFSLGEMNYYPRSSHILAAIIGRFLGSALLGLQVTTLLSIIVLWASLLSIVLGLPKKAAFLAAFILCAVLWLNQRYLHLEVHADEVIGNFFYAQLVAQAFVIFIVALTLHFERTGVRPGLRYTLLVAAIYIATGIHLLPALELLVFFIALVGVDLLGQLRSGEFRWRSTGLAGLLVLAAGGALVLHPSFSAMSDLSRNNGDITTRYIQGMGAFLAYSVMHIGCSCFILRSWLLPGQSERARHWLALKYIGLFGLAVGGLCLLQVLALQLGQGSEYSVRKYIFALNTSLLVELAMFVALRVCQRKPDWLVERVGNPSAVATDWLAPMLLILAFYCVTPAGATLDTSNLVALEHRLLLRRELSLPSLPGKFNYLAAVDGLPSSVAYMMSIGVLRSPRVATPQTSMPAWWMLDWDHVGTLVTSENSDLDKDPACRRAAPTNALVMLDGACLEKRFPRRYLLGFTTLHRPSACTLTGFSSVEAIGVWTDGHVASLRCPLPVSSEKALRTVDIEGEVFLDHVPAQRIIVGIKGQTPVEYRFDASHPAQLMVLKLPATVGPAVQIDFTLPDAASPRQLGLSQDVRQLGIAIRTIEFK